MEIILGLILFFWVLPWIIKKITPWALRWFIRRQTRKFMGDAFNSGRQQSDSRQSSNPQPKRHKKIDPSVGEYIEFTEISCTTVSSEEPRPEGPVESQISDIEWEDLP